MTNQFITHNGYEVPEIRGAGGGKGGGKVSPNSLFSTDFLYLTTAIGEGPVYRINPNGPQDIQIQDSSIDDLINLDTDGKVNSNNFFTASASGTATQGVMPSFGDNIISPQGFASPVALRYGNVINIPKNSITYQDTSVAPWDRLRFLFSVDQLSQSDSKGNVGSYSLQISIKVYGKSNPTVVLNTLNSLFNIRGKTDKPVKVTQDIVFATPDSQGYSFTIEKSSLDSSDSKIQDSISVLGWFEIQETKQAYPRTAMIGYMLKAVNEHTGGIPTFTSMAKGLLVKVPSNYNQPILPRTLISNSNPATYDERAGEIDWRQLELPEASSVININGVNTEISYPLSGYYLQKPGLGTIQNTANPQIYIGAWDGSFIYSWTQNPVWILYDILTNQTYGLGIPEKNIDKFKFYQVAQYCDACDPITGKFIGVDGLADGSYRYKPRNLYTAIRENQVGLPNGTPIKERRFISDISIVDQEKGMDLLNKIAATFRGMLVYAGGKITIAIDMPNEYPAMIFNEATIKTGTFSISGNKESDMYTGIDVSYIEPTNHFKRETIRINSADSNDGTDVSDIENIATIDLFGVTRRSQAVRMAQYQLAASKYQRRNVSFTTSTDALNLAPGDVISISSQGTGIAYGYGGKISDNSTVAIPTNTNVYLENYTVPSITRSLFTNNTNPLTLRVINQASDRMELYVISNANYAISTSSNVSIGSDRITVSVLSKFDKATKSFINVTSGFTANIVPKAGDLWSIGEIGSISNYYSDKAGKLFKVTNIKREGSSEEISVSGIEYIPNVYVDSDTFINYQPTSYTDIVSPFAPPPAPNFTLTAVPRRKIDGSVVVDGVISTNTDRNGYTQKFETEYYMANPPSMSLVSNVTSTSPMTFKAANASAVLAGKTGILAGKNGFTTTIGKVSLLCNSVVVTSSSIELTLEGLSSCIDINFNKNILDVMSTSTTALKGATNITIPVISKVASDADRNFVGYNSPITYLTGTIYSYNTSANKIVIRDVNASGGLLSAAIPDTPFYVYINQVLDSSNYSNNNFYIDGTSYTYTSSGNLLPGVPNYLPIDIKPRKPDFVRLYADGILVPTSNYSVNINSGSSISANVNYQAQLSETVYRVEVDHYTVPTIEIGDKLEIGYANVFFVANSSYDTTSPKYNAALTSNSIYRIELVSSPKFNLTGSSFLNTSSNPVGTINNVAGNSFTLDYDSSVYSGNFKLANSSIYHLEVDPTYNRLFLTDDGRIPELSTGITSIRARNKNTIGRTSAYVQKSVSTTLIPIQKVTNLAFTESLYIDGTAGVTVRGTVTFDNILNQDVTDYEISYKIIFDSNVPTNTQGGLVNYNTVKVPASGADPVTNVMSYTINNIDQNQLGVNSISISVTPLNKNIRGTTATINQTIVGKISAPQNILNFVASQQNDAITFLWAYVTDPTDSSGTTLIDQDLASVQIRRISGTVSATLDNYLAAEPVVTVSAGSVRKSIPISSYGTYTYLARTRDTSGNESLTIVGTVLTTNRAQRNTTVFAFSEDDSTDTFASIPNTNAGETNFPSRANSNTGGLAYSYTSKVDNANGSSSGWSSGINSTDLKAGSSATYITQIRDLGQDVTGSVILNIVASQSIKSTYNDQHSVYMNAVSVPSTTGALVTSNIGNILGYNNVYDSSGRYDSANRTWMTGPINGNVWAIWNPGINNSDTANANSYALISKIINANAVALGETYYANGKATGGNTLANITAVASSIQLVDLKQYNDYTNSTYAGDVNIVTTQTFIRTTSANVYYANGNVNTLAFSSTSDGFIPYEVGSKTFRYLQLKYVVNNTKPTQYDFTLDKLRYSIDKEKTIYSNTINYSTAPTTVNFSSSKFLYRPTITYAVLDQIDALANPVVVVTTASSNTSVSFQLIASKTGTPYAANSSANIMITAIGV